MNTFLSHQLTLFLLMFPAHFANGSPVFGHRLAQNTFLAKPIDDFFPLSWRPVFGSHKTIAGFIAGPVAGLLSLVVSYQVISTHLQIDPFLYASVQGELAVMGDAIKSWVKRKKGVPAGLPWLPFDQIDYLLLSIPCLWLLLPLSYMEVIYIIFQGFMLSIVGSSLSYMLGFKERWF